MGAITCHSLKWVIQGVSFKVLAGEAIGIVGINGAGKSTLLKMITGTSQPTAGHVSTSGRVAALLELGMGFHPDFTGRQNAFMAGQLLGLPIDEIARLMPAIESFAEINDYIDQPVRVYSSGMQVRLAFSVATAIRPDILIVDEALSVGDAYFQHKSFSRIREFRKLGTTLLLVSHDKEAIQSICDRAILLSDGRMVMEDQPEVVMDYYNAMLASHQNQEVRQEVIADGKIQTISGTGDATILDVNLFDADGKPLNIVTVGQLVNLRIKAFCNEDIDELIIGYMIKDRLGQPIFGTNTHYYDCKIEKLTKNQIIEFNFQFMANIGQGSYSVAVALHAEETLAGKKFEWRDQVLLFHVINTGNPEFVGAAWLPPKLRRLQ